MFNYNLMTKIHPTAIVEKSVKLADDVEIGAFCVLEGNIEIGEGTKLYNNVTITANKNSYIKIGKNNRFFSYCVIGSEPQDDKFVGEPSNVEIGDNNNIREYVTINGGSNLGNVLADTKNLTRIGNNCYLYIACHIAHDVYLEDNVVITNYAGIAGHCKIGHHTIIGGLTGVHQFVNIGHNVMIGGACGIAQDVPPFAIVLANPDRVAGSNIIGLKRAGFQMQDIKLIMEFYKDIANPDIKLASIIEKYTQINNDKVNDIIHFIKNSGKRGWLAK